jgi:hypothetical protein
MRTFVLLLVLMTPPLVVCGAAYAAKSTDIGKPVCTHFDDSTKSTQHATAEPASSAAMASASTPPANSSVASTTGAGSATTSQSKSGGTAGMMRPHGGPRWQTFLPGMFK